jgi:hypothetical protein
MSYTTEGKRILKDITPSICLEIIREEMNTDRASVTASVNNKKDKILNTQRPSE